MAQALREPALAYIYQPARNAMQSGHKNNNCWLLEYAQREPRMADPIMGWTATNDMFGQMKLEFATKEAAIKHAEGLGMAYEVVPAPKHGTIKPKSYASNFAYDKPKL